MSFKAFLLYPGMLTMVGLIAMLGAAIELRVLHKDKSGKEKFRSFVFSTFFTTLFSSLLLKTVSPMKHFLYLDELTAGAYLCALVIALLLAAAKFGLAAAFKNYIKPCTEEENHQNLKVYSVFGVILFLLAISFIFVGYFVPTFWAGVRPEQTVVNLISPTVGTEIGIYLIGFEYVILAIGLTVFFAVICAWRVRIELPLRGKNVLRVLSRKAKAVCCLILAGVMFVFASVFISYTLDMPVVFKMFLVPSDFIEKEYVDLRDVQVKFPERKRNLIYIYLESMENTYLSKDLGGYMNENLMPELAELAYEGDVFSNTQRKFGGPIQITGTEWSMASMVNQTMGIPMKVPHDFSAYSTPGHFLKGVYGLGDLLKDNGYEQSMLVGATAVFGGLDHMYHTHGDYKVIDYDYALKTGMIPPGYKVWWGFEDDKLFAFAKEELLELSQGDKPFNLTIETIDTHAIGGYLPDGAPEPFEDHYANAIAYNTRKVVEFVRWVQEQPFYENTTIILIGDHHSMDMFFFKDFDENYLRTTFNLILNPAESVRDTDESRFVNRTYANFDMFPTTLAAIGCEIEGNRAGLGTNLYSPQKTLLETYGIKHVDNELQKRSDFYNHTLTVME